MQSTSELYNEIVSSTNHWFETSLSIGDTGLLIRETGEWFDFGEFWKNGVKIADTTEILVDRGGAETGYKENVLISLSTNHRVFDQNFPTVGSAISGEIDVQMIMPMAEIPRTARLVPYVRATDGKRYSEWIQKGIYFIDTRQTTHNDDGLEILTLHGYDSMLKFEMNYPSDNTHNYPLVDTEVVKFLAGSIQITVDPRTLERMNKGYMLPLPLGYSSREVLQIIAGSYGGNFVITDEGQLLLIRLCDLPKETNYLVRETGDVFTFGEDADDPEELVRLLV